MADEWQARPDRPVEVPLLHVRLAEHLEQLKHEPTWRERGRNAITLTKEPGLRLVLMVLGQGTKISEHQAAGPLTLARLEWLGDLPQARQRGYAWGRRAHRVGGGHRS
jgi:hypothetical protein